MKKLILRSFLITVAVWMVFSWPLPRHVGTAIPAGETSSFTRAPIQPAMPCDALQLLYHFWLFDDMLTGPTPWFHNLYEFNTGDDAALKDIRAYYFPFSLFFTIGDALGGPAFGWNLSGFLALWLTYLATILLLRRYSEDAFAVAACALLAITFPYRWINITGGSPTGFTMMWVPLLLLGLDQAIRDEKYRGGLLAGLSLLMASWGDTHVFYFSCLLTPFWCLFALTARPFSPHREIHAWWRMAGPLALVALGGAGSLVWSKLTHHAMATAHAAEGRTWREVALFSPRLGGLWGWTDDGPDHHIYFGIAFLALLLLSLYILIRAFSHPPPARRKALLLLGLLLAAGLILTLALGVHGPMQALALRAARRLIPEYNMIRQPAKIFCLLPTLFALAMVLALSLCPRRGLRRVVLGLLLASVVEFHVRIVPVLSWLDSGQQAYAAAAAVRPDRPAALILPLWPGDDASTSLYGYYASRYRLRLVNGYTPFVPISYIENVFHPFETANQGGLDDSQLDALLAMQVPAIILHENVFPEKVSPFPVSLTLKRLLNHPRLTLIRQDGSAWAFRIEKEPQAKRPEATSWESLFPARYYDAKRLLTEDGRLTTRPFPALAAPEQRWMIRARGEGALEVQSSANGTFNPPQVFQVQGANWQWLVAPQPDYPGLQTNRLSMARSGTVEVDYALFTAGAWSQLAVGESIRVPAPCFFHAGYTDLQDDAVVLDARRERQGIVFYGPKLPLEPGRYTVRVDFKSPAAAGTRLGLWLVTCPEGREIAQAPLEAGKPLELAFDLDSNLPLLMIFQYHGAGEVRLKAVTLTRDG